MISAHDSIENGGREQGILGPIHVCSRLVNNTHPKKQASEFFCIFFVSWEPIVCTRSSSEISLSYKIIGIMIRLCNKTILLRKSYGSNPTVCTCTPGFPVNGMSCGIVPCAIRQTRGACCCLLAGLYLKQFTRFPPSPPSEASSPLFCLES